MRSTYITFGAMTLGLLITGVLSIIENYDQQQSIAAQAGMIIGGLFPAYACFVFGLLVAKSARSGRVSTEDAKNQRKGRAAYGTPVPSGVRAEEIVNRYGRALTEAMKFPLGAPESLLPRSREEIAAAIVHYTKNLHRAHMLDAQTYDQLHRGYTELAHFITDPVAHSGATAWAALQSGGAESYSDETGEAMARHRRIMDEKGRRGAEFDEIMARAGISPGPAHRAP